MTTPSRLARPILFLALVALACILPDTVDRPQVTYPETARADSVDVYHGVSVADPYQWLEDQNSAETAEWVEAQNEVTFGYLESLASRDGFREKLTELWDYPRLGLPRRENGAVFYRRNSGLERQSPFYVREPGATEARILIDPNQLSPDGSTALMQAVPSPDARHVAYSLSPGGADWQVVHVRNVATGQDLADTVPWVRFSRISWTRDGNGFFYSRYPERPADQMLSAELRDHKLYYHRIGTAQSEDILVHERPDLPTWFVGGHVTEDGRYLVVYLNRGTDPANLLYLADMGNPAAPNVRAPLRAVVEEDDAEYTVVGNQGSTFLIRTDLNAPRRRIMSLNAATLARSSWREIVPEGEQPLQQVAHIGGRLLVERLVDVRSQVSIYSVAGDSLGELQLPDAGTLAGISGKPDSPEFYFGFTSYLVPSTVFSHNLESGATAELEATGLTFDPSLYETRQVFYTSKDGTRVPMYIVARKDVGLDGQNPTLLYSYGGFSISMMPSFSAAVMAWLEQGGVYAVPSIRGGAEYGEEWHRAGMLERKQNVFDDFIGAAEYLIAEGWTSPDRLAIRGGSNGGLLVGAVMAQRPELFGVALPAVGVMDMLRYDRFTGGRAWVDEYGSATDDAAAFEYLRAYSPLHNLAEGTCYPATLVTTADHDDRVVPGHSFKFAATLQAAQGCDNPALIRVETAGSHGYRPTDRQISEWADVLAFTWEGLGRGERR